MSVYLSRCDPSTETRTEPAPGRVESVRLSVCHLFLSWRVRTDRGHEADRHREAFASFTHRGPLLRSPHVLYSDLSATPHPSFHLPSLSLCPSLPSFLRVVQCNVSLSRINSVVHSDFIYAFPPEHPNPQLLHQHQHHPIPIRIPFLPSCLSTRKKRTHARTQPGDPSVAPYAIMPITLRPHSIFASSHFMCLAAKI
ncbi:hypothetical protein B0H34DRAFT_721153 [Crassisporium funariophilum]|nr:hypothetical protein B0H34DRAFT_721153 [Crassisporium funariophilum]